MIAINLYEICMQVVNFLILLFLMNKFLFKPLSSYLETRSETISGDLKQAEQNKKESENLVSEQKEMLQQARVEAKTIRETAEEASKKERETLLSQTREESQRLISQAKKEIDQDVLRVKQELLEHTGELAVQLTQKILKRELSDSDKKNLVDRGLGNLQRV